MQKRLRSESGSRGAGRVATSAKVAGRASNGNGAKSVMAEMGSKGGKIGGKRRAENMSPEQRRSAASRAAKARWSGEKQPAVAEEKREAALRKIANIFEEQMTSLGLSDEEKNARVAEFAAFVDSKVSSAPRAKRPARLQSAALRA
jgi:hypothetical protein